MKPGAAQRCLLCANFCRVIKKKNTSLFQMGFDLMIRCSRIITQQERVKTVRGSRKILALQRTICLNRRETEITLGNR